MVGPYIDSYPHIYHDYENLDMYCSGDTYYEVNASACGLLPLAHLRYALLVSHLGQR